MIVRQFISWIRTASAGERAEATRSLARAWLISDLSDDDRAAAEGALLMLLDDPSPLVRQAMAEVFSRSSEAPAAIVQALSLDQPSVALPILEHSPLLIDADLVDIVATGNNEMQCAIARRINLPASVCAATLRALVMEDFLSRTGDGLFVRSTTHVKNQPAALSNGLQEIV